MVLRLFKGAQPALLFLIPVFALLLWLKYLILPQPVDLAFEPHPMPFYKLLSIWPGQSGTISKLLILVLVIINGLWLSRLNTKFILTDGRTYLPTFLFLITVSAYQPLQQLNPVVFVCILLTYCVEIMYDSYKKEGLALKFFQAAFLVSLASLFYARSAFMMFIIWAGLSILRSFNWREWAFTIIGFAVPYIFLFSWYYLSGQDLQEKGLYIILNLMPDRNTEPFGTYYLIFFGYLLLLLLMASLRMVKIYQGLKIYKRKFFRLNFWVFAISLSVYCLLYSRSVEFIYFLAVPVSYVLTHYLINQRSRWTGEIMTWLLVGLYGMILYFY